MVGTGLAEDRANLQVAFTSRWFSAFIYLY
ncbi:MAG: hypothetical protein ACI8S3_001874 [Alphaproteobacteria bacterium]|jgi:hypothetical protein